MSATIAIARREISSMFRLPVGWVVIALFALLTGCVFAYLTFIPGDVASMRLFFAVSGWLLLPVVPAISMRLVSEELRSGTIEALLTSPVSDFGVVLGKYAGGFVFLVLMLVPSLAHVVILSVLSDPRPDPGPIIAGYTSLLLTGALYLAVGLFVSSLTSNQTLAFLGTLFAILLLLLLGTVQPERLPEAARPAVRFLSIRGRIDDFAKGVIDTSHVVFFLSGAAWFVVLAAISLQSRRWR
jgi:ABC-2 type transport system permease protein